MIEHQSNNRSIFTFDQYKMIIVKREAKEKKQISIFPKK